MSLASLFTPVEITIPDFVIYSNPAVQAGMEVFPNSAFLRMLNAYVLLYLKHDGPGARTQLQVGLSDLILVKNLIRRHVLPHKKACAGRPN
jgi:hypothetical protein